MRKKWLILAVIVVVLMSIFCIVVIKGLKEIKEPGMYNSMEAYLMDGGNPDRALLLAIDDDDKAAVELAIEYGADVNAMDRSCTDVVSGIGKTNVPLLIAIDWDHKNVIETLINYGADVNYINERDESVLMFCTNQPDVAITNILLENGADVNYVNAAGESALSKTLRKDYNDEYTTKLVVELLLDYGAVPNEKVFEDFIWAGQWYPYQYNTLKVLVENADAEVITDKKIRVGFGLDSFDAFMYELPKGEMMDSSDFETFLFLAAANNVEAIEYYLSRNENINRSNKHGTTLLIAAATAGSLDVVKILVESGASLDPCDCEYNTAMDKARKMNEVEIVNFLMTVED